MQDTDIEQNIGQRVARGTDGAPGVAGVSDADLAAILANRGDLSEVAAGLDKIRTLGSLIVSAEAGAVNYQDWPAVGKAAEMIIAHAETAMEMLDQQQG